MPSYPPSLPPSFSPFSLSLSLYIYVCSIPFSLILLPPSCIQGRSQLLSSLFSHACPFVTLRACQAIPLWICVYNMCVHACVMREREREEERGRGGAGSKCWQKVHMIMCFCFSACQSVLCYPVCVCMCVCSLSTAKHVLNKTWQTTTRAFNGMFSVRRSSLFDPLLAQKTSLMYRLCAVAQCICDNDTES